MSWFGPVSILGECPRWDVSSEVLSWVDIDGGALHRARLEGDTWSVVTDHVTPPLAGAVAVSGQPSGTFVLAQGGDLVLWREGEGGLTRESVPVLTSSEPDRLRLNETVTDPRGRIWVGSMAYDWTPGAGSFYVVEPDGMVRRVLGGYTITNGVGWSPDGSTMYTTETQPGCITAWDVGPDGDPIRPRAVVTADGSDGKPDGLAVDVEGNLWSAFAGGGHVTCFSTRGVALERIEVPTPLVTSCCFTGPLLDRLVVTTGTKRVAAEVLARHPGSGRAWDAGLVGVSGLPQCGTIVDLAPASRAEPDLHSVKGRIHGDQPAAPTR